jgi:hypothetical protein
MKKSSRLYTAILAVAFGAAVGDADAVVLQLRHMLATQNFSHSVQAIGKPGNEANGMAEYFPAGQYTTTLGFEAIVPCQLKKPKG